MMDQITGVEEGSRRREKVITNQKTGRREKEEVENETNEERMRSGEQRSGKQGNKKRNRNRMNQESIEQEQAKTWPIALRARKQNPITTLCRGRKAQITK